MSCLDQFIIKLFEKNLFHIRVIKEEENKIFVFDSAAYDFVLCPIYAKKRGWDFPSSHFSFKSYEEIIKEYEKYKENKESNLEEILRDVCANFTSQTGVMADANIIQTLIFKYVHKKFPNKQVILGDKTWKWRTIILETNGRYPGIFAMNYEGEVPKISDIENSELVFNFKDDFEKSKEIFDEKLHDNRPNIPIAFGLG